MTSERTSGDSSLESGSRPLDIDDVHILLQVEQEQIQKRTFTNWINAQLSKRRPPVTVLDLFNDLRDGSRLLDLLEVMSDQRMSREKGRGTFQHRTNIEKALEFLKRKSIKLVNINVSDIMDGKPSIILGLVWTIIMHFHIEELASTLSFSSRQPSLESLASLDSRSTSSSARSSPVPPHGSPLHARFRVSAKKALLLWVREQCHRAGCTLNVKDFKGSWRSGVVFLAILSALRPNSVNLTRARTRTNRQNLEEAFLIAERELHIPRLLDPADVDVRDPDEKSIMTYVAQFLQYSKETPSSDEEMCHSPQQRHSPVNLPSDFTPSIGASPIRQVHLLMPCPIKSAPIPSTEPTKAAVPGTSANQKAQEVTCWLVQAYEELIEGWDSTEGESYAERYHVFHTFIVSFNEQRRPVMPLLTAMKRTPQLSAEQKALRRAWDTLAEKLREYKTELDLSLPSPLDSVGRWLLRIEEVLSAEEDDSLDHAQAAEEAREKLELLKVCLEEMPHHLKRFNMFQNTDEFGETLVPRDKMDEMKRRFTSVRVTAKYHSIKIEYQERRHTVLDLLNRLKIKLRSWKRAYVSLESVRVLMQDWNETLNNQELASMLDGAFHRLKNIATKYTSKAALAEDSTQVNSQVAELERDVAATLEGVRMVKGTMARVLGAWDTYSDTFTSLHAWLEQGPHRQRHGQRTEVTLSMMSEWNSRQSHLNEVGNYLIEVTDPQTSRGISDEVCKINLLWAEFSKRAQFALAEDPNIGPSSPQTVQSLIREANQLLKEPVEVVSAPLRTYTKRLQLVMKKIKDVDLEALSPSLDCSRETLSKLQQAIPEVLQTLCEAEQVCDELRLSVSGLDSRLAELLHWETEARELHQVLKEETHRRKRGQDPRVRLLISKGLQLEGQVVMEDQDLQVMVMTSQKSSPLQYLIASYMQDKVRGAVEKSQEAVGMLSSLGACRDRSPARDQPPAKIFVQPQEGPQSQKAQTVSSSQGSPSGAQGQSDPQPAVRAKVPASFQTPLAVSSQAVDRKSEPSSEPLPMIVVQEYDDENKSLQVHTFEQWEHSQFTEMKSQEVVQSQARKEIHTQHYEESQQTLTQPVTQPQHVTQQLDTNNQLQMEAPVAASQPQQKLQRSAPQAQNQQQSTAQPQMKTQQQEKIQIVSTIQKQQVQTPAQPQPQVQKEIAIQHQALHQQQMKTRKSQARNRPWLQQKSHLESANQTPAQVVASHIEPEYKGQISFQAPLQTVATSSLGAGIIVQSEAKQVKQTQPFTQHQQPRTTSAPLVTSIQPQQPLTIHQVSTQQHQTSISTQAQVTTQKEQAIAPTQEQMKPKTQSAIPKPQTLIQKQTQHQSIAPTQPHGPVMAQWQPQQTVAQTPSVPQPQRFPVSQGMPQSISRSAVEQPPTSVQPQVMMQRQQSPQTGFQTKSLQPLQYPQSVIAPQPKSSSPMQPRIISMPQPQMPVQPEVQRIGQTQLISQASAPYVVQPQEQPQWGPITQTYPQVQGPISVTSQMHPHFQKYPQSQSVHLSQHPQWPPIRPDIVTQTYTTLQAPGQVQIQPQMPSYTKTQPQQWPSPGLEPLPHLYGKIRPQGLVQQMVPPQHWRPVGPVYTIAETQSPQYSQYQALQRPQSPQQQWASVRAEHQPQVSAQTMFQGVPHTVAQLNYPPAQAPTRPQSPQQFQQTQLGPPKTETPSQIPIQSQSSQLQSQVPTNLQSSAQEPSQQQSSTRFKQPTLAQAPPQAYTEAYMKAQALVRNRFEEAKHCLQEHIIEGISIFKDKQMTREQASVKEETLKALDSELLEEFLRAAEGMEAFCTPSELRDMEFFTQSVRTQWEAVQAHISEYMRQLRYEITRQHFNRIVEACEMHFRRQNVNHTPESISESKNKACFSAEGSLAQAGQQLEALKELCDTLSPEDAHRLAQAQLRECERRLAAIQRQFSGEQDTPPPENRSQMDQTKDPSAQKAQTVPTAAEKPKEAATAVSPPQPRTVEKREIVKQTSTEEDRYRSCRFALLAQLNRNEQCMLADRPSESVTPTDLQKRLKELKCLWDETESLWKEYETVCMQSVQFKDRTVDQDRMELTVRWRDQRSQLQRGVESLGAALELMNSVELKISEISERLDKFIKEPKDIKGYTLANPAILRDVKDLDESIQAEMDRLSRFDSEPSHLDLRDRSPLTQVVLYHRSSLDRLRQQVRKSDAAARALDRFLMSLRTVELDVSSVQSAPSSDPLVLQDSRSKLTLIRKGVSSLNDKAPQLDQLLGGAQLEVTQEGKPVSCLDMVGVLVHQVEEVDERLMVRQKDVQKEQHSQGVGLRRKTMLAELRKVQGVAEKQGLKDPTLPAVQHRIRSLSDLESQLNSLRPEYQSIKMSLSSQKEQPDPAEEELNSLWDETEKAVSDRQDQCTVLMELLKKFQSCRSFLGNTLQRAEQTINEQASYMGKDNLQRLLTKVIGIKEDLGGLGSKIEEFRAVCRKLQSQLKKIPDCSETPFEAEADGLVDSWLDVSEKTDSYMDNLRMGLELWEKQLALGGEVDSWTSTKLIIFSESHPFTSESEVLSMKNEIQTQEDNIEHFHRKSLEIQELLQSKESPLELQVIETNLGKKMEQVKELFSDCTDVFEELLTVKAHLSQKIDTSQSSVENIRSAVEMVHSEDRVQMEAQLQDLCEQLLEQEEQADALLKEISLMFSITGPEAMEDLINQSKRLKERIAETKNLICQKKDQGEKSFLQTIKEKFNSFEEWLQDEQLSVNECFENPERREDVEASMQRLTSFLSSKEGEQRLGQLKEMFERSGMEKIPSEAQALLSTWQQEQEGELATLRAHCHGRHKQLDDIIDNLNNLQEEHNHLKECLRQREDVPLQREKLRHLQEELLQESGRVEAFHDLLSTVRMRGLRGDPLLKDSEALIDQYHSMGIILENQAQVHKALDDQAETFQNNAEQTRAWIRDFKQGLETLEADTPKQMKAQAVFNLSTEGDAKLVHLKEELEALCNHEILEDARKHDLIHSLRNMEDEWKRALDSAQQLKKQAELQDSLSRELQVFKDQEESARSWIGEQLQILHSLGKDFQPQEKLNKLQAVLDLHQEAASRLASLKRQRQIIFSYKELDNERRSHIDQTQSTVEEECRKVVQLAQELENQVKHDDSLFRELQTFGNQEEDTRSWIRELREILKSLEVPLSIQERMHRIEGILAHKSEGDFKLADLKRKGESLCFREELEEDKRLTIQQNLQGLHEDWTGVMTKTEELKDQSELEESLSKDLQDLQEHEENTQSWIRELQIKIELLGEDTQLQERITGAQAILNSESDGNCKLATLRREAEGLWSRAGLGEKRKQEIHQNLKSIEEEWKKVIVGAQERKNKAELQDSLSRELEIFHNQEESIRNWMKNRKDDLESLGKSTYGTQEQIEERLNKAQAIQTFRSEGNSKIADLKRTADDLNIREDLDEDIKLSLSDKIKRLEAEWEGTMQEAQELHSLLRSVVERLESCHCQREQLQSRLEQVKQQIAALPHHFPWPGYGDRRHTVDQARSLLDRTRALTPSLSALRALGREMSQLTRDSSWIDPSWVTMEECIPELIKELTEFCVNLEMEVRKERVCAQLVEQHTVAQDWLREQVKAFGALPTERRGLQNSINTLKALLQTVEREKKEMKELDAVKNSLMDICTPGGRDTLTLEVSHLHDLCVSSEEAMREQLVVCEARLGDIETRIADRALILRSQAESLLRELRIQDNSLGFLESSQNISQLQENWHNFKIFEKEIEAFEGKVRDLGQVLRMAPTNEVPPCDVISLVDTVTQQYCSLRSKLLEKQNDCADSTVQCVRQAIQNIQSWNQKNHANPPSNSATSMQAAIEECSKLRKSLQVALSHEQLLRDCLGPDLAGKLERDGTKTLNETDTHISVLKQELKILEEKVKQETERLSMETQTIQQDSQVPSMITEVKFKLSEIVSPSSFTTESCLKTGDNEQAIIQPSEDPDSEIPVCEISETTTEIEMYKTRQSLPMLESDTQPVELKTTASEMVPELDTRVCETPVLTSSSEPNKEELSFTSVDLATMPENDDVIDEKMQTPSSEALYLAASVKDIELHDIEIQESQFSTEVLSSDFSSEKLETEKLEVGTEEIEEDNEDAFIPDSQKQCGEGSKNIAALILDVDTVHIQILDTDSTTESLIFTRTITDENAMSKQDGDALAPPKTEDSEIAIEAKSTESSLHEPGVMSISEGSSGITSDESQLSDTDTNKEVQATQAPPTETQGAGDTPERSIETLTWNNGPTVAQADREGNWAADNGPRELQRRYIVLDFPEGMEMQRRTATSFREPTEAEIQGFTHPASERVETEGEILSAEDDTEVLDNTNKHLEAAEMTEPVEAIPDVPARKKKDSVTSESLSFDFEIMNVIQEEGTDQTPSEDKEQCIAFEHVSSTAFIQRYQSATGLQSDKVDVFPTQEKLESGDSMYIIENTQAKTTPSGQKAKSIEFESKQMSSVPSQVSEGEPVVQLDKVDISLTLEEKYEGEDILHVNEEEETKTTPSDDKGQCLEAEPKPTPPVRRRNEGGTEVQSEKIDVSLTPKEKTEVGDTTNIFKEIEAEKTPSGNTQVIAQPIKFEPKHVQAISQGAEGEPEIQLDKVSSTPKENPESGNTMYVIVEAVEKITASADRPQCIEIQPKPTPPVRRQTEDKTNVELDVIPTPPSRRRKGDRLSLNLESQILEGEVLPTPPSRRRREKMGSTLSLNLDSEPTPPGRRRKDRENRRFSLDLGAQPTPPARRRKDKEDQRLSIDLGVPPTPPGRRRKDKEDQRLSLDLEGQPTPPERRHKDKEDRRLSLDLEAQPTPPERRRKDKEDRRLSLDLEAQPTPPERRRKEKEECEKPTVKPTPTVRRNVSGVEADLTLAVCTSQEEETFVTPTPPTRRKDSKVEKEEMAAADALQEENSIVKPTPPLRRKDSQAETEMVLATPPTRRKKDQSENNIVPSVAEDSQVIPTQPTRRKTDESETDIVLSLGEDSQVIPIMPTRGKKDESETEIVLIIPEEPHVIPTPPTRGKTVESETDIDPSMEEDSQVIPITPPRGLKDESETDKVPIIPEDPQVTPTPPARGKKDESETDIIPSMPEESHVIPTPPTRRKKDDSETDSVSFKPEDPQEIPTPPTRGKKNESETDIDPSMEEDSQVIPITPPRGMKDESETDKVPIIPEDPQVTPTPPARGKKDESETDIIPSMPEESHVIPTPPTRRKKDDSETDSVSFKPEDPQEIPTPPTRGKKNESETDIVAIIPKDPPVIPTPPTRRKKDESETDIVSIIPEETHVVPTPPIRRKKDESETELVPIIPEEPHVIPTPPTRRKKDESETDIIPSMPEESHVIPTPPTRREKDDCETDSVSFKPEDPQKIPTPPTRGKKVESETQDESKSDIVPLMAEDPQVILTPQTRRKRNGSETDIVPFMPEEPHVITSPPTRRKKDESETDSVSLKPAEPCVIPTPPTRNEENSEQEKVSIFVRLQVEANVEPGTKQEEVEKHDRVDQLLISQEHLEEGEDSFTLVQEPIDVLSQIESICDMQLQDQKGEISAQAVLTTENIESSEEEVEEPLGYTIMDIFTEIKKMTEKGAKRVLIEGMPHKSTLNILDTSSADLEARLKRLVFHLLDLRNHPAALNSKDMAKQLKEAEECRTCAQTQVSMLSKQDQANGDIETSTKGTVHDSELMQQLSAQWNAALWDAASAVHSKEAQLQMVADFERQIQRVKASLERLRIEREALRRSPSESSFVEEERLRSFLRNVERERSALGELIQTLSKLSPHLSPPERHAAEIQENNLQSQWRVLEIDAERALYKVNAYAKESASLLQEVSALKDHLENIQKTLDASKSSPVLWDSSRAQEIMRINAELTSSQQQYLNLQQTSEALAQFKAETSSIEQELQNIKEKLDQMGEWIAAETPTSSNPTLSKIVKVMTDALAWAKQTQCDIKGRQKKVPLLPEEVHRQIKTLKKLQLEMSSKQTQLKTLVEEVSDLIPKLEKADVPMVTLSLKSLEDLSKSTAGQLAEAVREIESGLQTREKMSEQIADVDSWVVGHLRKEALRREDYQSLSVAELDRRLRQIQDTLGEAEKHSALTEALLMKSKDMFSELNVSESSQLNEKLTNLQEDIKNITCYEKACCQKVMDVIQSQESSQRKVSSLENSLRQMLIDVKRHRFPVTKDTLSSIEPFKQMVVERKSQIEQVSPCAEDKRRELLCVITELHHQMNELDLKAQEHERYLSLRQCVEDLMQDVVDQILRTKDVSIDKEERYRDCQALLTKMSLIKLLCEETKQELHDIKMDLYPTQVSAEETRLKQILENLQSRELALSNNLRILEWDVLKNIHYPSEIKAFQKFLQDTNEELEMPCNIEPKERVIEKELRKCLMLRKDVESRMRVLEFLEKSNVAEPEKRTKKFKQLTCLKDMVLDKCDQRMVNLTKAKQLLRNYTKDLINTIRFLQRTTLVILPSVCSARSCSERLKDTQQTFSTLDTEFQSHISQLQTQAPHHPCFKPQKIEYLQTEVLGVLLVRLSTLKAQAQIQLESLMRCVECQKQSRKCYEDLCQQVRDLETSLSQCTSDKTTSHKECKDQGQKLKALVEKVDMLPGKLENLREWCPLHGCRANREDAVSALWGQAARLQRCANDLQKRTEQMEQEWSDVTQSVQRAASVLDQVEAELPDSNKQVVSGDELQELLLFWSQYQDRLDCEHRALSALELRAARLLGIPSHLEKAPPIALCQELQALQERYHSLKERSTQGQRAVRAEMEERERVQEQLLGVKEWLDAAVSLLSVLEHEPSKKQLQEVHSQLCTQKAVLQRISEGLKMMYSNRNMLVPEEIEGLLQEVSNSLQEAEEQVETAVEKSGPLHRLAAKISEIKAGLGSVVSWLEQKSLNFSEAESTQKRVWDELEGLHTRLTAVEVELQDMSEMYPDETRLISENLANAQQTYSKLTKQAEQRTSFLSKVHDWLKEHEEMVKASQSWISEAQSWLTTACTYTTARCLDSHVNALQMVLDDSAQMRQTLQHFGSVLTEMGSVFDVSPLGEQLSDADRRVADMQHSLLGPLSQLEHAAAEVDAIEAEMKVMEKDVAKIKSSLNVQEGISRDKLKATENRIELMKKTVAEIQNCKEGLCLPDKAENTLLVFKRAELLQKQLEEIEQLALEYSIEVQEIFAPLPDTIAPPHSSATPHFVPPTIAEEETQDTGEIQIVHVEEDALKKSGATLMTVGQSTPEQRLTWISERDTSTPTEAQESEETENLCEDAENTEEEDNDEDDESSEESEYQTDNEQEEARGMSASSMNPETSSSVIMEETSPLVDPTEEKPEQTESTDSEVAVDTEADTSAAVTGLSEASSEATEADTSAASGTGVSEASSEATEESESLPTDMVTNTSSVTEITSSSPPRGLQRCLVS